MRRMAGVHKKHKIAVISVLCILAVLLAAFGIYINDYYHADAAATEALQSDGAVTVMQTDSDTLVFSPKEPTAGLIFYPGGKVEYTYCIRAAASCIGQTGNALRACENAV